MYSRGTGEILKEVVEVHEGEEKDKHSKKHKQPNRAYTRPTGYIHDTDFGLVAEIGEQEWFLFMCAKFESPTVNENKSY